MDKWVIFDADNTLWQLEPLYDRARSQLALLLNEKLGVRPSDVEMVQRQRDKFLFRWMGYDLDRFPQSFTDTAEHFLDGRENDSLMRRARALGKSVFESDALPFDGVEEVLSKLSYVAKLGLITSGPEQLQKKRLWSFPYKEFFGNRVKIVKQKNARNIRDFCKKHQIKVNKSWMVGDSILSDIIPAHQVGLNTIHIQNPNWSEVEIASLKLPAYTHEVKSIKHVPEIIFLEGSEGARAHV